MADNISNDDMLAQVQHYRDLQLRYEALDSEIDALLAAHKSATGGLSGADLAAYRDLFQQRADVLNDMRIMEQILFEDE